MSLEPIIHTSLIHFLIHYNMINDSVQVFLNLKKKRKYLLQPWSGFVSFVNPLRCSAAWAAWKACNDIGKFLSGEK